MSHKTRIAGTEKIAAIEKYLPGEDSLNYLASVFDVHFSSVKKWLQIYQSLGPTALLNTSKNTVYISELKYAAVQDYLAGAGSYMDICKRYWIKSPT